MANEVLKAEEEKDAALLSDEPRLTRPLLHALKTTQPLVITRSQLGALEAEDLPHLSPISPHLSPSLPISRRPRSGLRTLVSQPALERTRTPLYSTVFRRIQQCSAVPAVIASLVFTRCSQCTAHYYATSPP